MEKKLAIEKMVFVVWVLVVIFTSEMIGAKRIVFGSFSIGINPLVFAVLIAMVVGIPLFRRGIVSSIYSEKNVSFAGANMIFIMLPLMARYGADVAPQIHEIIKVGWVFFIQCVGNVGTVLIGLPIALLLGLGRQSIGATLGIGREGELAYISEKFGLKGEEGRGVLSMYLIGTLFGAIIFSFLPAILNIIGFDYRALAIGTGLGSASMMTAASTAVAGLYPDDTSTITAYAAAAQLVTSFMGTYVMVFLSIPLMNVMYRLFKKETAIDMSRGSLIAE